MSLVGCGGGESGGAVREVLGRKGGMDKMDGMDGMD